MFLIIIKIPIPKSYTKMDYSGYLKKKNMGLFVSGYFKIAA